ncbi:MAG: hypothetical protein JO334_03675 [Verrucomicrobia bacterium]|nr:hypothetical protein [Verrucomicrobiota bacterium]
MKKNSAQASLEVSAGTRLPGNTIKDAEMRKRMDLPFDTHVDVITRSLHDAIQEIHYIDKNKSRKGLSILRYHILLATLRNALRHARSLEKQL